MIEPSVFREAIAVHAILHAAGVDYVDIFVMPDATSPAGKIEMGVIVMRGDFTFMVTVGPCKMSKDEFLKKWPKAIAELKKMSTEEAVALRDSTKIRDHAVEIIAAYTLKWQDYQRRS